MAQEIRLDWQGPCPFVGGNEADLPHDVHGVYLFVVRVGVEYLVHYVGQAGKMVSRWSEHLCNLLGGRCRVYDPNLLCKGEYHEPLYADRGGATNLLAFSSSVARTAYEYARATPLFYASFPESGDKTEDKTVRKSVESGIIDAVQHSDNNAGRLLSNGGVSLSPCNAYRVVCTSKWPTGIRVAGIREVFRYGELGAPE